MAQLRRLTRGMTANANAMQQLAPTTLNKAVREAIVAELEMQRSQLYALTPSGVATDGMVLAFLRVRTAADKARAAVTPEELLQWVAERDTADQPERDIAATRLQLFFINSAVLEQVCDLYDGLWAAIVQPNQAASVSRKLTQGVEITAFNRRFATIVREARKVLDWSTSQLANELGESTEYVEQIEGEGRTCNIGECIAIARALNLEVSEVFKELEDMPDDHTPVVFDK